LPSNGQKTPKSVPLRFGRSTFLFMKLEICNLHFLKLDEI